MRETYQHSESLPIGLSGLHVLGCWGYTLSANVRCIPGWHPHSHCTLRPGQGAASQPHSRRCHWPDGRGLSHAPPPRHKRTQMVSYFNKLSFIRLPTVMSHHKTEQNGGFRTIQVTRLYGVSDGVSGRCGESRGSGVGGTQESLAFHQHPWVYSWIEMTSWDLYD